MTQRHAITEVKLKTKRFSIRGFATTFAVLALLTGVQTTILCYYMDIDKVPIPYIVAITLYWIVVSFVFILFIHYQVREKYEKPIQRMAEAASKVANGDFSVYVAPEHTPDKADYLDKMISNFNRMVEELGSIETLKTDFLSNVSHEIKTPLAVISNYVQMLSKGNLNEQERKEYLDAIKQATKKLTELITNILKLSRLEKQSIQPFGEPYDVCKQLCDCALSFETMWEKKQIEFEADIEDRAVIEADDTLLEVVWNNLLSNAIKFTEPGGKVALIQTSTEDTVSVTVTDSGCGMSKETLEHIFDKFYQGDTSHAIEGNGLGLSLVLRVLQMIGGTITAKSVLGTGSTFKVTIPTRLSREEINNE